MKKTTKMLLAGITIGVIGTSLLGGGAYAVGRLTSSGNGRSSIFGSNPGESNGKNESLINEQSLDKIKELQELVDYYYLEDADSEAMTEGMYQGMIDALEDPYSVYYNKEETKSLTESIDGTYSGIGATLSQNTQTQALTIIKCFENTPAMEAGLLPGDLILEVDGTDVTGMDISSAVALIKGKEGTTVDVKIYREGETDYLYKTIERRKIDIPTISYQMREDKIGYLQITSFDNVTTKQFDAAYQDLTAQGMEGLILDLRDNPGGMLDVVCDISEYFLPEGLIVYTEDKYGTRTEYKASGEHTFSRPVVVLVNGNSASASEILAGALKDTGTGTIVGTNTYGKGIVQQLIDLGDETTLKLTISKYFTPNGNDIHKKGIAPDVEVELDEALASRAVVTFDEDNQYQKAMEIIKEQLAAQNP